MFKWVRRRFLIERRRLYWFYAARQIRRQKTLWHELQQYLQKTESTGCSFGDYWVLYCTIRRLKPMEVLECGPGVSTLVIAQALMDNEKETGRLGRVTSMEEHEGWFSLAKNILPEAYRHVVELCLSGVCEDSFSLFRGVRYANVPERPYDFVFVDGPKYVSPLDGHRTFDFDFLHVLLRVEGPVAALIDKRVSTCFVLQQLLGRAFTYNPVLHLGIVKPVTKEVLGNVESMLDSRHFEDSFKAITSTSLCLNTCVKGCAEKKV